MGLFSAGFPTGARVRLTLPRQPYEPASHFPLGAGHIGHREAPLLHLQLFKSNTGYSSMQLANRLVLSSVSRLPENINDPHIPQLTPPVERPQILWESPSDPRQFRRGPGCFRPAIIAKSVPIYELRVAPSKPRLLAV